MLGKSSGRIIDSIIGPNNHISKYKPFNDSSYIKLPKELEYTKKTLTNNQNIDDNECFKWCLVRYLHVVDHYPAGITKVKGFAR